MTVGEIRIGTDDTIVPVSAYATSESASPTIVVDSSGTVGAASVTIARPVSGWRRLYGRLVRLTAAGLGEARLYVRDRSLNNKGSLDLTLVSIADRLNIEATVPPVKDTLADAVAAWMEVAGIAPTQFDVDAAIAGRSVVVPGWKGNLWSGIKTWCAVECIEVVDAGDMLHFRPLRTSETSIESAAALTESLSAGQPLGRFIEIYNYNSVYAVDRQIYPPGDWDDDAGLTGADVWTPDVPVLSVTQGQKTVTDVPVNASLLSVEQPVCVKSLARNYSGPSAYTVLMNDGVETVDPAVWTAKGGKVTVEILEDTTTLRITIDAGGNTVDGSPYRLCMSAGDGSDYSTLRIRGTGVVTSKRRHRFPTGYTDVRLQEVAQSIDSVFIGSLDRVHDALFGILAATTESYASLNATLDPRASSSGNAAGSRIRTDTSIYRVRQATFGPGSLGVQAEQDVTFADFDAVWDSSKTLADFDAAWTSDFTLGDFAAQPLASANELPLWTEQSRNLAINPRAVNVGTAWLPNNNTFYPVTKGVVPPVPHPLGIGTAVMSQNNGTASPATSTLASIYNADGLGALGTVQRSLGVWVLVTEPGYRMSAGPGGLTWPADELPAGVWTWVKSLTPVAASNYATTYIAKNSGVASTTARAYLTGLTVLAGTVAPASSFDGSTVSTDPTIRYRWLGATDASASVIEKDEHA